MGDTQLANIIRLPDGRRLCCAGYGALTPRLEARLLDSAAHRLG